MKRSCRNILLASLLASFVCGCASMWHDLKRVHHLNRGDAPTLNPEFTSSSRSAKHRLVRLEGSARPAEMSANSADVTLARGPIVAN